MFEGITATMWLTGMAVAAAGAGLIGLIRPARARWGWFGLWLIVPGLIGGATSDVSGPRGLLEAVVLTQLFLGVPWVAASIAGFGLARLFAWLWRTRTPGKGIHIG